MTKTARIAVAIALALGGCASDAPAPDGFGSDDILLVCGTSEGAPNELHGCVIGVDEQRYRDLGNSVRALTQPLLSPTGSVAAFAEPDGMIAIRTADGRDDLELSLPGLSGPLDWSSDGSLLLLSDRSSLIVVDLDASRASDDIAIERFALPGGHDVLGVARFSPDAALLAVGTKQADLAADEVYGIAVVDRIDGSVQMHGEQMVQRDPTRFTGTFADPAFDPSGRYLAWAEGVSGSLWVLDRDNGSIEEVPLAAPPELITGVSWSPSGLIAVGVEAELVLIDTNDAMARSKPLPVGWSITAAAPAWSSDGTRFVVSVQHPDTDAILDMALVDLGDGSVRLLTSSSNPPEPTTAFPGFPAWNG